MGTCFTLATATRALAFIEPVLTEIRTRLYELANLQQKTSPEARAEMEKHLKRLKLCFEEFKLIGALCRDPERGIIDFPSFHKNIPIFLCWHLGESRVEHWHYVNEDSTLRRPVDAAFLEEHESRPEAIA